MLTVSYVGDAVNEFGQEVDDSVVFLTKAACVSANDLPQHWTGYALGSTRRRAPAARIGVSVTNEAQIVVSHLQESGCSMIAARREGMLGEGEQRLFNVFFNGKMTIAKHGC
jgi:hypothetical protein